MTTDKQLNANQQNSQKSTGPISQEGKDIVSKNALKHGVLSREALIVKGQGKENQETFDDIKEKMHQDLQPVGFFEEVLVDRIIANYWRLRRVIIAENGIIRKGLDTALVDSITGRIESEMRIDRLRDITGPLGGQTVSRSSFSYEVLIELLEEVEEELEASGYISEGTIQRLINNLGQKEDTLGWWIQKLNDRLMVDLPSTQSLPKDEKKEAIRKLISKEKERLNAGQKALAEQESLHDESNFLALHLPADDLTALQRYETTLERSIFRTLHELQRLQIVRKGDKVMAPISIDIEADK